MEHSTVKNVTTYTHRIPVGCSKQLAVSQPWAQPLALTLLFPAENLSVSSRVRPFRFKIFFVYKLKGTVSRDFLLLVYFMNQFPPSPRVSY